jgi:hypothetical protein
MFFRGLMQPTRFFTLWLLPAAVTAVALLIFAPQRAAAGAGGATVTPDPTPIIVTLTPTVNPSPTDSPDPQPSPTPGSGSAPADRFEPNDQFGQATVIGFGVEEDLTLTVGDEDWFTFYGKMGQLVRVSTYVDARLDTKVTVYHEGQVMGQNDDRSATDLGSTVIVSVTADGWYAIRVERVGGFEGYYALEAVLLEPTATPTLPPSPTPTIMPTPTLSPTPLTPADMAEPNNSPEQAFPIVPGVQYSHLAVGANDPVDYYRFIAKAGSRYACETITNQVDTLLEIYGPEGPVAANDDRGVGRVDSYVEWQSPAEQAIIIRVTARGGTFGPYALKCAAIAPPPAPNPIPPPATPSLSSAGDITSTAVLTAATTIPLTVRRIGQVVVETTPAATTAVRLLIYYDANNDRQPSPGEGVSNVSVMAVNGRGGPIARVFTNAQGEAVFHLTAADAERVIVPFVPAWYSAIRRGQENEILLGLPAVRLPVFIPVRTER